MESTVRTDGGRLFHTSGPQTEKASLPNWVRVLCIAKPRFLRFFFGVEAANDAQSVWVNTACGKDHSQKNQSKPILWYSNIYNQIASDI